MSATSSSSSLSSGDGAGSSSTNPPPPSHAPPTPHAQDLIVEDGVVVGGTPAALTSALIAGPDSPTPSDTDLFADFLLTYRYFITPPDLVAVLARAFDTHPRNHHGRIVDTVLALLAADPHLYSPLDASSVAALDAVLVFVDTALRKTAESEVVAALRSLARTAIHVEGSLPDKAHSPLLVGLPPNAPLALVLDRLAPASPPPLSIPPPSALTPDGMLDIRAIAAQMTLISFGLYSRIEPLECLKSTFSDDPAAAPTFTAWTRFTNRIREWLVTLILTPQKKKHRAKLYACLLKLPMALLELRNFHDALNTWIALAVTPELTRLKGLRDSIPDGALEALAPLEVIFDSRKNSANYLSALAKAETPLIPALSILSSLLYKTDDAQPDTLPDGKVNFRKLRLMGSVMQTHLAFQKSPYYLNADLEIVKYLQSATVIPEPEWDALSVRIEKRKRR